MFFVQVFFDWISWGNVKKYTRVFLKCYSGDRRKKRAEGMQNERREKRQCQMTQAAAAALESAAAAITAISPLWTWTPKRVIIRTSQPGTYIAGLHHYLGDDKKTSLLWSKTWCLCSTSNMMTKNRGRNKLKVVITICVQIVHAPPLFFAVFETSTSEQEADTRITQLHRSTVRKRSQNIFALHSCLLS